MSTGWYEGMTFTKDPATCTHTTWEDGYWEQWGPDVEDSSWVDGWNRPTSHDLDIHRYQCTQCGTIKSY